MCAWLGDNPVSGMLMAGTGGVRKVRFAGRGKGKSGGYRTLHYFGGDDVPLFLLALIDKGQKGNLTKAERNTLADLLPQITASYKAGVIAKAAEFRRQT